ncbi:MAG TPA: PHB depolymerase family esterase [Candidatus Polarisedimenticolia bacterium]|nr:PHB depolymerase family esterase [Candidatus Polarisedimenticolia bacterium]
MNSRKIVIRAVQVLIGLPIVLVLIVYGSFYAVFYFPNRSSAITSTIVSSGQKREYLLYVPKSYDRAKPTSLVINLHTAMSWPTSSMNISQWNLVADEQGFIVVYPAGTGYGPKSWAMTGSETPSRMPDVIFISELLDKLEASYNIDKTRIYANGMSNGGSMAFVLSCTLSDRIAAVGMVSAGLYPEWNWCTDHRPVPVIAFHGTADPVCPYNGGRSKLGDDTFPSVPSFMANWSRRNRCGPNPIESPVAADVTRLQYTDCADDAGVVLYTVKGGGHQWPNGKPIVAKWLVGPYSRSIDATGQMWAFFREHRLPKK